jgi:hypothetical protein
MNKDFEQEFKSTVWKGLVGREVVFSVIAFLAAAATAVTVWYFTGIPINVCVYTGIPVMIPIAAIGILKYQGATLWELLKEFIYFTKTRELSYDAEEYQGNSRVFTMKSRKNARKGRR